jgi:methionine-rich copper-binding protein CopC
MASRNELAEIFMKRLIPLITAVGLTFASQVYAHAHLLRSIPANHSTLSNPPTAVTLEFQEAVQLTALAIQKGDATVQKIAPLVSTSSKTFTSPLPVVDAGHYVITWRARSADGHVMSNTIEFTVSPPAPK